MDVIVNIDQLFRLYSLIASSRGMIEPKRRLGRFVPDVPPTEIVWRGASMDSLASGE